MNRTQLEKLSDPQLRKLLKSTRKAQKLTLKEVGGAMGNIPACNVWHTENDTHSLSEKRRQQIISFLSGEPSPIRNESIGVVVGMLVEALPSSERVRVVRSLVEKFKENA